MCQVCFDLQRTLKRHLAHPMCQVRFYLENTLRRHLAHRMCQVLFMIFLNTKNVQSTTGTSDVPSAFHEVFEHKNVQEQTNARVLTRSSLRSGTSVRAARRSAPEPRHAPFPFPPRSPSCRPRPAAKPCPGVGRIYPPPPSPLKQSIMCSINMQCVRAWARACVHARRCGVARVPSASAAALDLEVAWRCATFDPACTLVLYHDDSTTWLTRSLRGSDRGGRWRGWGGGLGVGGGCVLVRAGTVCESVVRWGMGRCACDLRPR